MKNAILLLTAVFPVLFYATSSAQSGKEIKIGSQVWAAENLDVVRFSNGDPIPQAKTPEEWEQAGKNRQPAWCTYNNKLDYRIRYNKIYNAYAVADKRGLCPTGWHVPSDAEWTALVQQLDGEQSAARKLKTTGGWHNDGNGTNSTDFSALPGGGRNGAGGFYGMGMFGYWWTSTPFNKDLTWIRYLFHEEEKVFRNFSDNNFGHSVRCIRD
jgi:uncharacterized protein (TIGR02145 family)